VSWLHKDRHESPASLSCPVSWCILSRVSSVLFRGFISPSVNDDRLKLSHSLLVNSSREFDPSNICMSRAGGEIAVGEKVTDSSIIEADIELEEYHALEHDDAGPVVCWDGEFWDLSEGSDSPDSLFEGMTLGTLRVEHLMGQWIDHDGDDDVEVNEVEEWNGEVDSSKSWDHIWTGGIWWLSSDSDGGYFDDSDIDGEDGWDEEK